MANIDYDKMARILTRCAEIGTAPSAKTSVKTTYAGVSQTTAEAFLWAYHAAIKAESVYAKATNEAEVAIARFDKPFREARSVVMAFIPTAVVPATLKRMKTDTDRLRAIEQLQAIVGENQNDSWATELLTGEFGQKAEATKTNVMEAIAANLELDKARKSRAIAYGPAYDAYLRFKRVVKDALGATSVEYKRIHVRDAPAHDVDTEPPSVSG